MSDSGGEVPARLRFTPDGNGGYAMKEKIVASDGADYEKSIRAFCKGYPVDPRKLMDSHDAWTKVRKEQLSNYVRQNQLDIEYYKDYGWDPVKLEE